MQCIFLCFNKRSDDITLYTLSFTQLVKLATLFAQQTVSVRLNAKSKLIRLDLISSISIMWRKYIHGSVIERFWHCLQMSVSMYRVSQLSAGTHRLTVHGMQGIKQTVGSTALTHSTPHPRSLLHGAWLDHIRQYCTYTWPTITAQVCHKRYDTIR